MLADVVQRKGCTAGSLDGWGWSLRSSVFLGMMSWRAFSPRLRILGFGLMGCWIYTAMIPKTGGDAPSWSETCKCSPDRLSCSSSLGYLILSSVLEVVVGRWKLGILLWILRKFLLVLWTLMSMFLLQMSLSLLIRFIGVFWIVFCAVLGFLAGFVMLILSIMLVSGCGLSWRLALASPGLVMGVPQGCPLSMMFIVALYLPWCRYLAAHEGFSLSCMLIILSAFPGILICYCVLLVSPLGMSGWLEEPAPSKCVLQGCLE